MHICMLIKIKLYYKHPFLLIINNAITKMMSDIYSETVKKLSKFVLSKLDGSNDYFRHFCNQDNPSRYVIIGSLANRIEKKDYQKSSVQEYSMSLKFLTKNPEQLSIKVSYSIFESVDLSDEERLRDPDSSLKLKAWERVDFEDIIDLSIIDNKKKLSFNNENKSILGYDAYVEYREEKIDDKTQVTISVENDSKSKYSDKYIFNVKMTIMLGNVKNINYYYEYIYEGSKKVSEHLFRTINCCAKFDDTMKIISTSPYPIFCQHKNKLKTEDKGVILPFEDLSANDCTSILRRHLNVMKEYEAYYDSMQEPIDNASEFRKARSDFTCLCKNYEDGIKILETNEQVHKAFRLMNKTFSESSDYNNWRIFQIVYIVSLIPCIVDSERERNICDVIHVDTGGGKTEAYLGLAIFTMFYERILGKDFGITAIIKFPLRMLSVQQIERVAQKVIFAEKIRAENKISGDDFSAAFYVGKSDDFPNETLSVIKEIINNKKDSLDGRIIKVCPLCTGKITLRVTDANYIVHHCTQCKGNHKLFYTDEEIYRFLPTILISTVDKFSGISMNRYVKGIFGHKMCVCESGHGLIPSGERCRVQTPGKDEHKRCGNQGKLREAKLSTAPTLIVQDELHLIRESFGTINAHFESFCEELQYALTETRPKHIAMTATITGCSEQILQLYNKDTKVFPGKDPSDFDNNNLGNYNPFSEKELDDNVPKLHRMIIGLRPNGRENQYATNLTLKYIAEFVKLLDENRISYSSEFKMDAVKSKLVAKKFNRILTYHNKKSDVYSTNYFMKEVINDEREYRYDSRTLTSDNSTDEIQTIMNSVKKFQGEKGSEMHVTLSTSIVSHGVDIEEWNIMEFQGIPNNTAEYIQAMSRVGRKYTGLIFIWFYPNRVRDISFYHNFSEYHGMLDHKIEPVSINKWTELSFMETCTSIMCATILNYLSAIKNCSIYKRDDIIKLFDPEHNCENTDKIIEFMHKVYHTDSEEKGSEIIRVKIEPMVKKRLNLIFDCSENDPHSNFFPHIITKCADKYCGIQIGMRGIQESVKFTKNTPTDIFVSRRKSK